MILWLSILGMGIITYSIRLSLIVALRRVHIKPVVRQALEFVPPAVLSAIIFPELLLIGGSLDISTGNSRLLAGVLAMLVAWRTKSVLLTVGVGMVILWILQAVY